MPTKPQDAPVSKRESAKIIRQRMETVRMKGWSRYSSLPPPDNVKAALKVVEAWEKKRAADITARQDQLKAQCRAVEDALIEGDTLRALKLLKQLEA